MSDKLRTTFPIAVQFAEGEQPSDTKLNGLASQAKNGLGIVEYAIGDLWNQGGDSLLALVPGNDSALMIPNIARSLGAPRQISPRIPYLPNIEEYTHEFTTNFREVRLDFPPAAGTTYTWSNGFDAIPKATKSVVLASGNWWIDTNTGDIYAYDTITAGDTLTYKPIISGDLGSGFTFNVIPDPDTDSSYAFGGVKIERVVPGSDASGYYIYLPPRGPLNTRRVDQSPQDDVHVPAHSGNFEATNLAANPRRFWQADTLAASTTALDTQTTAEHYRYCLPEIITDNWSQAATLPMGMLYLWDHNSSGTGTIIEGVVFSAENVATPNKYLLVATGSNLTAWLSTTQGQTAYPSAALDSSSHAAAYYPSNGLRLITVGTDLSSAFSSLLAQYLNHDHSSQGSLVSKQIDHSLLKGLFYCASSPQIDPTYWDRDDHAQYLHRFGTRTIDGDSRDKYNNGILGDILLCSTGSTGNYQNITADSRGIFFGIDPTGGKIYWDAAEDKIICRAPGIPGTDTGLGIQSYGLHAAVNLLIESTAAYAYLESTIDFSLRVTGDLTLTSSGETAMTGATLKLAHSSAITDSWVVAPRFQFGSNCYWYSNAGTHVVRMTAHSDYRDICSIIIDDFPHGMDLNWIKIWVKNPGGVGVTFSVIGYRHTATAVETSVCLTEVLGVPTWSNYLVGAGTYTELQYVPVTYNTNMYRGAYTIVLDIICNTPGVNVYPFVQLNMDIDNAVSEPWLGY